MSEFPQVVKTKVRHDGKLTPASRQGALALHGLIAIGEDPAMWSAQQMTEVEMVALLIRAAARFHEGEAPLEEVMGALVAGAAWIAKRHGIDMTGPATH